MRMSALSLAYLMILSIKFDEDAVGGGFRDHIEAAVPLSAASFGPHPLLLNDFEKV